MKHDVIPQDGMVITEDVKLAAGVYALPNGLTIGADGVTVDGEGVTLIGDNHQGVGVHAENRSGITIQGIAIAGFYHGIRFDRCKDVTIEHVRVHDTAEIEGIDVFLYLWHPIEQVYSGAILFHDVQNSVIRNCDLQHQMNGILLYGCSKMTVEHNNASFNSGWGLYLSNSTDNTIQDNRFDFCNRVYRRPENGSIRVEADAAGIVLVINSSRNKLLRNSCLCGGDGIFIAGCTPDGERTTCDDNLIEDNDCRLSPNNAIESTFSRGNIFRRNDCSSSNYGFWLGYSWDNVLEDNHIEFNRWAGIAIEHGHGFAIRNNRILSNGEGVRLFTRGGITLNSWQGWEVCYDFAVEDNLFKNNRIGFNGYTGQEIKDVQARDFRLNANTFQDNRVGVRLFRVNDCQLTNNRFEANVEQAVLLLNKPGATFIDNALHGNAADMVEREA